MPVLESDRKHSAKPVNASFSATVSTDAGGLAAGATTTTTFQRRATATAGGLRNKVEYNPTIISSKYRSPHGVYMDSSQERLAIESNIRRTQDLPAPH